MPEYRKLDLTAEDRKLTAIAIGVLRKALGPLEERKSFLTEQSLKPDMMLSSNHDQARAIDDEIELIDDITSEMGDAIYLATQVNVSWAKIEQAEPVEA